MHDLNLSNKIYASIILIFLILLSAPVTAGCVWINKTRDLAGYKLTSLAADKKDPGIVYVGAKGFLFKTLDSGENWKNIFKVPGINKAVNFIAIDPKDSTTIYIATESGIFKSGDGGVNWQNLPLAVKEDNVLSLLIDSEHKNTLFAGTVSDIFKTKDGGKNWTKSSEGFSGVNIRSIAQNYMDPAILYASCENGLFKSEDGAQNWKKIFSENFTLYEYAEEGELLNPSSWVLIDPLNPEIIYLSTKRGIFKSEGGGDSWVRLPTMGPSNRHVKNLISSSYNRGFIFAATGKGVFRFSEEENIWRDFHSGLNSKDGTFIALGPRQNTLWLTTTNRVYKSKGDIYEIKEASTVDKKKNNLQNLDAD